MIDIHSHVLYSIDDGAQDIDTSVQMCIDSSRNGCDTLVLTPHFVNYKNIDEFISERDYKIKKLSQILISEDIPLNLLPGSELFLSDKIFSADNLDALTINHTRYMLCEMPLGPFNTDRVLMWFDELLDRGYLPILAHPERYYEFHKDFDLIDAILNLPVIFQVNIDSLTGRNGPQVQGMAVDMVSRGIASLMASDAHDLDYRHTRIMDKLEDLPPEISEDTVYQLMEINARKIINGEKLI